MKRLLCIGLLVISLLLNIVPVNAVTEQTTTIPVTLSIVHTTNNIDVTMPVAMPVSVLDGKVLTADNVEITNNSKYLDVEVVSVRVENGAYNVGDFDSFPKESKDLIALNINRVSTKGPGLLAIDNNSFPKIGVEETLPITYNAKVSDGKEVTGLNVAQVIFVLKVVDEEG